MPVIGDDVLIEDQLGEIVPEKLEGVFISGREFERKVRALTELQEWVESVSKTMQGAWLFPPTIKADLENAKRAIRFGRPYAVCPYCKSHSATCGACKGHGYINRGVYNAVPVEIRG